MGRETKRGERKSAGGINESARGEDHKQADQGRSRFVKKADEALSLSRCHHAKSLTPPTTAQHHAGFRATNWLRETKEKEKMFGVRLKMAKEGN